MKSLLLRILLITFGFLAVVAAVSYRKGMPVDVLAATVWAKSTHGFGLMLYVGLVVVFSARLLGGKRFAYDNSGSEDPAFGAHGSQLINGNVDYQGNVPIFDDHSIRANQDD